MISALQDATSIMKEFSDLITVTTLAEPSKTYLFQQKSFPDAMHGNNAGLSLRAMNCGIIIFLPSFLPLFLLYSSLSLSLFISVFFCLSFFPLYLPRSLYQTLNYSLVMPVMVKYCPVPIWMHQAACASLSEVNGGALASVRLPKCSAPHKSKFP